MENIREIRQEEAAQAWLQSAWACILEACPRFGKIRTSIKIMKAINAQKVLIAYPRVDIKESWEAEFRELGYRPIDVSWTTFTSLEKVKGEYNLIIVDEIHELSKSKLEVLAELAEKSPVLGLTGTMTKTTERTILRETGIGVCYTYTIEQGVEEGIISDYDIYVHEVDLDDERRIYKDSKGRLLTEKRRYSSFEYVLKNGSGKNNRFMELKMIQILQNSRAKVRKTMELLEKFKDERVLVFCGVTDVADQLGIPVYHSKEKDTERFLDFCRGGISKMATVKMAQAGITVKPIQHGVLNHISGSPEDTAQKISRFLGVEYDNLDKKAKIHIVSSKESFERFRIQTALSFFEQSKIHYV